MTEGAPPPEGQQPASPPPPEPERAPGPDVPAVVPPAMPPAEAAPVAPPPTTPPPAAPVAWSQPEVEAGPAPGVEFAPHGGRLVAYIIDSILIGLLVLLVAIVGLLLIWIPIVAGIVWLVGILVVVFGYFPYFWARSGQTPGMRPFDLWVVRDKDGGKVSGGTAFLRMLVLYFIDGLVFYLGFIWVFIDKRRRAWHDLIAGTVVIKRPRA